MPRPIGIKIGDCFGDRTVIDILPSNRTLCLVLCKCGRTDKVRGTALKRSIGDRCRDCARKNTRLPLRAGLPGWLLARAENNARDRGILWDVSDEHLFLTWENQHHRCALTNWSLYMDDTWAGSPSTTASLDRIDSKLWYVAGNVQWVHKDVNKSKLDHDEEYFISMCVAIATNVKGNR